MNVREVLAAAGIAPHVLLEAEVGDQLLRDAAAATVRIGGSPPTLHVEVDLPLPAHGGRS